MSWQATSAVKRDSQAQSTARLFFVMLADYADDYGICWPAIETVADDCRLNEKTVRRQIQHLEQLGELIVRRRYRATSLYILNLPSLKPWDDAARAKVIEALSGDYPDDLERAFCPRTEARGNVRGTYKNYINPLAEDLSSLSSVDKMDHSSPRTKRAPYFRDSGERVPRSWPIEYQMQSGEPMVWDTEMGRWRYVEWLEQEVSA